MGLLDTSFYHTQYPEIKDWCFKGCNVVTMSISPLQSPETTLKEPFAEGEQ